MKCVVMQPTFFPWAGYFNLMAQADCFVFFDDVQLEIRSWQVRNRILVQGKAAWISIPVVHRGQDQIINQTEVFDESRWRDKLYRQIFQSYARHQHHEDMLQVANKLPGIQSRNLAEVNIALILACCEKLNIMPKSVFRSSELDVAGKRSDRLIRICEKLGCDEYLSPVGSADYLAEDQFCERTSINLSFQQYSPVPYLQKKNQDFVSHLSIIDVVASLGWAKAADYVRGYSGPSLSEENESA